MFANLTVKHVLDLEMKGQLHQISRDRWFRMFLFGFFGVEFVAPTQDTNVTLVFEIRTG